MSGFFAAMIVCVLTSLPILGAIIGIRAILKKPIKKLALAVAICAASIIPLTVLGVVTDPATWCNHQWGVVETVEATCKTKGYTTQQCELCDRTRQTDKTSALGHSMRETSRIEPTTSSVGNVVNKCERCGYEEVTTLSKLDPPGKNAPKKTDDGVLKYALSEDKSYYIVKDVVDSSVTEINIPNSLNGVPVKSIGKEAFKSCRKLVKGLANMVFAPLQKTPTNLYPKIDIKPYQDKLAVIKAAIQSNLEAIKGKIAAPATVVTITAIASLFDELNEIIEGYNALIKANNDVVAAGPKKRSECVDLVFSLLAFRLKDIVAAYNKSDAEMQAEIEALQGEIDRLTGELETIKGKLKTLRGSTVETETAKESINTMLRDSGMQGFSLHPKSGVDNVYEVRRADGTLAENLSEGEKNFIAFLYFYHLVYGSDSAEGETRDKIVVIDDPVSSMDSASLFIVSTLVRQMVEVCRNNADNRNRTAQGNFIKQIFVLTHNAYFHREVSYSYVSKYDYASFYLIRKVNMKSCVKLCDEVNPNEPTERMNINPVKNSYAALWDEYKEVKSAVPLMNVIRRILEYYFLQLCGYEGSQLRDVVLVKAKADGRYQDEHGNELEEKFQLASAMLAYINASTIGMNDGMDFVEECLNADECRKIFAMIFEEMGQIQHYNMMMGI